MAVEPVEEAAEALPDAEGAAAIPRISRPVLQGMTVPRSALGARLGRVIARYRYAIVAYLCSRGVYLLIAALVSLVQRWSIKAELSNWDGEWYRRLAGLGYPNHVLHVQSTLGFFPLYPMLMWLVQHTFLCSIFLAGVLISGLGGFITTVLVQHLSEGWWGREASRRAVLFFCFFPGSIVFSMVYSEGVMLPLAVGCILALQHRRWVLAGVLAAFATAVGPTAVPIILACAVTAVLEIRRRGWQARRALAAPLLAPAGIVAVGIFLWAWVGSPLASYQAQHTQWNERTNPLALVTLVMRLVKESYFTSDFVHVNLNYISGLVGAVFLFGGLYLLYKTRPRISTPALVWTLGVAFLAVTSENVPPNPRLLITAFPVVLVMAYRFTGSAFWRMMRISGAFLFVMTACSFVSTALRP